MLNITLSFFILVMLVNVKAATFQNANNNSIKLIAYNPVVQPTATFTNHKEKYTPYLDAINDVLSYESEKTKYSFQGGNYHWVITDFDIFIDNDCRYDFESNYPTDLMDIAHKLKASVYDRFEYELTHCLIKYEKEPKDEKLKKRAKKFFEALIQNSDMKMKGHFIKIIWDNENKGLTHNVSLYFSININKNSVNATYDFELPKPEVVEPVVKPLRKLNFIAIYLLMLPEFKNFI